MQSHEEEEEKKMRSQQWVFHQTKTRIIFQFSFFMQAEKNTAKPFLVTAYNK